MRYFDIHGIFYNNPDFQTEPFSAQFPLYMLPELTINESDRTIFVNPVKAKFMNMKNQELMNISPATWVLPFYVMQLVITRMLKQVDGGKLCIIWYRDYCDYVKSQVVDKFGMNFNFFKQVMSTSFYAQIPFIDQWLLRDRYNEDPWTGGYYEIPVLTEKGYVEVTDAFGDVWKVYNGEFATGFCLCADVPQYSDPSDKGDSVARTQLFYENLIPLCEQQIDKGLGGVFQFKTFDVSEMDLSQYSMYHSTQPDVPPITPI